MNDSVVLQNGTRLALDEYGHLADPHFWSSEVAELLAARDDIELTGGHWLVLGILRHYYQEFGIEAPMRAIVKALREQNAGEIANSRALYRLFPEGPVRQGSRYAGLPIPVSCI